MSSFRLAKAASFYASISNEIIKVVIAPLEHIITLPSPPHRPTPPIAILPIPLLLLTVPLLLRLPLSPLHPLILQRIRRQPAHYGPNQHISIRMPSIPQSVDSDQICVDRASLINCSVFQSNSQWHWDLWKIVVAVRVCRVAPFSLECRLHHLVHN